MAKILVAYFSLSGNTRLIGKTIAKEIDADVLEIVPSDHYPLRGALLYAQGGFQSRVGTTPPLEPLSLAPEDYDAIIIGTPVWAGRMTPPVRSFLTQQSLAGKTVAFFCTFLGGESQSLDEMVALCGGVTRGAKGFKMTKRTVNDSVNASRQWAQLIFPSVQDPR